MVVLTLAALASAFEPVDEVASYRGCTIRIGAPIASGVQPLRAECHWADVTAASVAEVLSHPDGFGRFIVSLKEERMVSSDAAGSVVWQHVEPGWGLAPREDRIVVQNTALQDGHVRWQLDPLPFPTPAGVVLMPRNEGEWRVTAAADGGVDVVHELLLDPGGSVPTWVVNWFQTYGMSDALKRLHGLAAAR